MKEKVFIKKPCTAPLEEMQRVPEGVLCTDCNLVVHDFTHFTNEQLTSWISQNAGKKSCGIFKKEQVKIPFFQKLTFPIRYFAISIVSLFVAKNSKAQNCVPHIVQTDSSKIISIHGDTVVKKFFGKVTDQFGTVSAYTHIRADYNGAVLADTITNVNGEFEILVPCRKNQIVTFLAVTFDKHGKAIVDSECGKEEVHIKVHRRRRHLFRRHVTAGAMF